MKTLASILLGAALVAGCQNTGSKLDNASGSGATASLEDLQARVAKLEAWKAQHEKAMDFLQQAYDAQQQQIEQQRQETLDPTAMFAVPIDDDVKVGLVEGPATACVTMVEAWDFA